MLNNVWRASVLLREDKDASVFVLIDIFRFCCFRDWRYFGRTSQVASAMSLCKEFHCEEILRGI
jgi:hypothetical protein